VDQSTGKRLRRGRILAAVTVIASLAAACGGPATPAGPAGGSNFQIALGYARCMRSHGALNWPDPNSQGQFLKTQANSADFRAPVAAYKACQHLLPNGGQLTVAEQQKIAPLMLRFATCMRSHGITNFPDPLVNGNGVAVDPHGFDPKSPLFKAAQRACQKYMSAAAKYFPPG
jgi:hypothetical protein